MEMPDSVKKISEKKVTILTLEYQNYGDGRKAVFDYLDSVYGQHSYRIVRAGPKVSGPIEEGLIVVHVEEQNN